MRISHTLQILLLSLLIGATGLVNASEEIHLQNYASYLIGTNAKVIWHPTNDWLTLNISGTTAITIVDAHTGEELSILQTPSSVPSDLGVTDMAWSENGEFLAVTFLFPNSIDIWQYTGEQITLYKQIMIESDYGVYPFIIWEHNQLVTVVGSDIEDEQRRILLWKDTFDEVISQSDLSEEFQPYSVMPSPEGEYFAAYVSAFDPILISYNTIVILDKISFNQVNIFPSDYGLHPSRQPIWYDANTLIGVNCAVSFDGCNLWKWDINTNYVENLLNDLNEQSVSLWNSKISLNISHDILAVSDTSNQMIHIIDLETGEVRLSLDYASDFIQSVAWNLTGDMLAVTSGSEIQILKIES